MRNCPSRCWTKECTSSFEVRKTMSAASANEHTAYNILFIIGYCFMTSLSISIRSSLTIFTKSMASLVSSAGAKYWCWSALRHTRK